jgi:hypothetical protein
MSPDTIRKGGLAAVAGGVFWISSALITASKPRGCIGDECDFRTMRETGALDSILFLLALLLFAVGTGALVARLRNTGSLGRLGRTGLVFIAVGASLATIGMVLNVWDFSLVPAFIIPGLLAVIVGFLLLGVAVLRSEALPRWASVLLVVGALAMLGFNDQNWQALMAIPFGIGWIAVGYALWSGRSGSNEHPARVV